MIQWWINNVLLADAGISGMTASIRMQATSQLSFSVSRLFDQGEAYGFGMPVVIRRALPPSMGSR